MPRKKQTRKRHKKETVAIGELDGMLRLRWTFESKPYMLAIGLPNTL